MQFSFTYNFAILFDYLKGIYYKTFHSFCLNIFNTWLNSRIINIDGFKI